MADDLRSWFPLYVSDMLNSRKVRKMTALQFGIFMALLIEQWAGGPLPEDKSDLCDMAKCPSWEMVEGILQAQFVLTDKGWVNERLVEIWMEQKGKRHAASRAGKIGAEARWGKKRKLIAPPKDPVDTEENGNRNAPAIATALPSDSDRSATPMALEESRGEESRVEESTEGGKRHDPEVDVILVRNGLDWNGNQHPPKRGYCRIPRIDFEDVMWAFDDKRSFPQNLVIETQEELTAFLQS